MLKKNDEVIVKIDAVLYDGFGIGKVGADVVFVPKCAENDELYVRILKVTDHYCIGKTIKILNASEKRAEDDCPAYQKCGGCCLRHIRYEEQLKIKMAHVQSVMKKIAHIDIEVLPTLSAGPYQGYRNKAQYPVAPGEDGAAVCGFYAEHSHRIVRESLACRILPDRLKRIAAFVLEFVNREKIAPYREETHTGLVRNIYVRENYKGEVMLCPVINGDVLVSMETESRFCQEAVRAFPEIISIYLNQNKSKGNVILGGTYRLLYGSETISERLLGIECNLSPDSFFQVNRSAAELLYRVAFSALEPVADELTNIYDLYCGIGVIGLALFRQYQWTDKRLFGIEIVEAAVKCAEENARLNHIGNAEYYAADAKELTKMQLFRQYPPSLVILDPPRKGIDKELLNFLIEQQVKHILYISCDPATLARDMSILYRAGYHAPSVQPVDMFPATKHVESVVLITRVKD